MKLPPFHKADKLYSVLILTYLLISYPFDVFPQSFLNKVDTDLFLYNYTVRDGLSESSVNCIFKDSRGVAWIGTDGGLNRFNAYNFEVFKNDTSEYSISHNIIYDIIEDDFGNIWIGTSDGLNKYLPKKNGFKKKYFSGPSLIENMCYDPHRQSLWLAMGSKGLVEYHIPSDTFRRNQFLDESIFVTNIAQPEADSLIVGTTDHGIFLLNTKTGEKSQINESSTPTQLSHNGITALGVTDRFIIAGTNYGLNLIDPISKTNRIYSLTKGNFSSDLIVTIEIDKEGYIWVGTDGGGINKINSETLKVENYQKRNSNENHLQSNVIREIYEDDNENIWVGTFKYGFGIHNKNTSFIHNVKLENLQELTLKNTSVSSFSLLDGGNICIGTDGGGLLKWDGKHFERIPLNPGCQNCAKEKVQCLINDDRGNIWAGTFAEGLYCRKKNGEVLHFLSEDNDGLNSDNIWDIKKDKNNNLWLATASGLTRLNLSNYKFTTYLPHHENDPLAGLELRSLAIDKNGLIWMGSFSGLYSFDPVSEKYIDYYNASSTQIKLNSNVIVSLYLENDGNLWLGTYGQGIQVLNIYDKEIVHKDISRMVGDKVVNFIHADQNQNIWAGTNTGIISIKSESKNYHWFNTNNGLQDDVYSMNAVLMINDSTLIAGGIKGFVMLNTYQLSSLKTRDNLILEKINYENTPLPFNPYTTTAELPQFEIDYSKASLNIHFTAIDYTNASSIRYSYLLENFDKNWASSSELRQAIYTNLPPGNYLFKVKTTDLSNPKNEAQTLARIIVKPAWWMTLWFKISLSVLLVLVVVGIIKYRSGQHKRSEAKLVKAVNEKTRKIELQKEEIGNKKFEIELRNKELMEQNKELQSMNEELNSQKETINIQRESLEKAHQELKKINSELEEIVKERTGKLNNTISELNKTISELDRFVYSASHDLGAPLKSILGLINIAKLETKDEKIKPHLDFMNESVHKLEDVIQSLIQYSRNSRLDIHPKEIGLAKFICDSFETLKFMPGFEDVNFQNSIKESRKVITDENRLKIIVRNLLSNAIKYSDPEKNEKWVQVKYNDLDESHWQLIVADNGLGIAEGHLKKIFDMFYRANESSDGSGLGLYITKEAITKLNGKIDVESEIKKGTQISVTLSKYY